MAGGSGKHSGKPWYDEEQPEWYTAGAEVLDGAEGPRVWGIAARYNEGQDAMGAKANQVLGEYEY